MPLDTRHGATGGGIIPCFRCCGTKSAFRCSGKATLELQKSKISEGSAPDPKPPAVASLASLGCAPQLFNPSYVPVCDV